jgi:hypothetical protein
MGKAFLVDPTHPDDYRPESAFYGDSCAVDPRRPEFKDNGIFTDAKIELARQHLEDEINKNECGYGGFVGGGSMGGIQEVCVQPWTMGGPARGQTTDGYAMQVTVKLEEKLCLPPTL